MHISALSRMRHWIWLSMAPRLCHRWCHAFDGFLGDGIWLTWFQCSDFMFGWTRKPDVFLLASTTIVVWCADLFCRSKLGFNCEPKDRNNVYNMQLKSTTCCLGVVVLLCHRGCKIITWFPAFVVCVDTSSLSLFTEFPAIYRDVLFHDLFLIHWVSDYVFAETFDMISNLYRPFLAF